MFSLNMVAFINSIIKVIFFMKLKLPAVHSLGQSFLKVISRFPLQVLLALAARK